MLIVVAFLVVNLFVVWSYVTRHHQVGSGPFFLPASRTFLNAQGPPKTMGKPNIERPNISDPPNNSNDYQLFIVWGDLGGVTGNIWDVFGDIFEGFQAGIN